MKKFLIQTFATALLVFIVGMFFPWWTVAAVAFLVALIVNAHSFASFLSGVLALGGLWLILALNIHNNTEGILSDKMALVTGIASSGFQLAIITSIIGALIGGLSALSGTFLRRIFTSA
jgi:hypothetical protein